MLLILDCQIVKNAYHCLSFRCDIVHRKLWESIEREDALHWLSTLGGAFSNLGEHNVTFVSTQTDYSGDPNT